MKLIELYSLAIDGICILINSFKFTIEIDHRVCVCVIFRCLREIKNNFIKQKHYPSLINEHLERISLLKGTLMQIWKSLYVF